MCSSCKSQVKPFLAHYVFAISFYVTTIVSALSKIYSFQSALLCERIRGSPEPYQVEKNGCHCHLTKENLRCRNWRAPQGQTSIPTIKQLCAGGFRYILRVVQSSPLSKSRTFSSPQKGTLHPLAITPHFALPVVPSNSALCLYKFACFGNSFI